jgi:hypothetical protein
MASQRGRIVVIAALLLSGCVTTDPCISGIDTWLEGGRRWESGSGDFYYSEGSGKSWTIGAGVTIHIDVHGACDIYVDVEEDEALE